ncbi:DUF4296 domain-containing protein [Tunicatimonas pelagia]|nr:DUF4296 domain-containing protein [Tunicatimonas pelagia]WKN44494.1 DUF4296 domain-containing protein [Tunicatimonas pelagia]
MESPVDLLDKSTMASILIDLHLAEAKMSYTGSRNADSIEIIYRNYEYSVFKDHNVTDSIYFRSYEYYLDHMAEMEQIYSAVVDSLSVMNSAEKAKDLGIANR